MIMKMKKKKSNKKQSTGVKKLC